MRRLLSRARKTQLFCRNTNFCMQIVYGSRAYYCKFMLQADYNILRVCCQQKFVDFIQKTYKKDSSVCVKQTERVKKS